MKKIFRLLLILSTLVLFTVTANAQANFDTLVTKQVSDGVTFYNVVENSKPWDVFVLEVDLTNPLISIESIKAKGLVTGNTNVSDLSIENSYDTHEVVGAINGDFFDGNGVSTGHQISNGELVSSVQSRNWSKIAFDNFNKPFIERFNFSGEIIFNGSARPLNGVNSIRNENYVVLYNSYKGSSTGTNQWGSEYLVKPISQWVINDTVKCVVTKLEKSIGNMKIDEGFTVLSAHGTGENYLTNAAVGDTLSVVVGMSPQSNRIFSQLISGFPKIVKDGQNYALSGYAEEGGESTFATDRHPRTSAGFSADSTKLLLFVVDGRQPSSIGMSLMELADFMIMFGVHTGLNLDGGGSSTMVVKNEVANSPSGGLQRAVSNALLVVSSELPTIEEIRMIPDSVVTNLSLPVQFYFESFDKYGYKQNNDFSDASVFIGDPTVGNFSDGIFTPLTEGSTMLDIQIDNGSDQSIIEVIELTGETLMDRFEDDSNWILSGEKIDAVLSTISSNSESYSEGSASLQLDYSFTYQAGQFNWAYLNADIPIDGVPENIKVDVLGDGRNHTIAFVVEDENEEQFALITNKSPGTDEFETLTANFQSPIDINQVNARFYFPIRIKQIAISLNSERQNGELYSGRLLFDNLVVQYPDPISSVQETDTPSEYFLSQNYPNPFNPSTSIEFAIPHDSFVEISIFSSLGEKVETVFNDHISAGAHKVEFNAEKYSSGIYFYRMVAGEERIVKRMILLK